MADRNFKQSRNVLRKELEIMKIQIVARIQSKAELYRPLSCEHVRSNSLFFADVVLFCIGFGVQFYTVRTRLCRAFDHLNVWIYEYRSTNAGIFENADHLHEVFF